MPKVVMALGESRTYGQAFIPDQKMITRNSDFYTLAHEAIHLNGKNPNSTVEEAIAVILGIFGFGAEKDILRIIYGNRAQYGEVAQNIAILNEGTFALGRDIFELIPILRGASVNWTLPKIIEELNIFMTRYEKEFLDSNGTAKEYLVNKHGVTEPIAKKILEQTGVTRENIFRNTCGLLKDHISAFKSLVSFYHINLKIDLNEAIFAVEKLFEKDEAIDIASTIYHGAQEAFSMLTEAKCDDEMKRRIVFNMVNNGAEFAIMAAKEVPKILEFIAYFGPKGGEILKLLLSRDFVFKKLIMGGAFSIIFNFIQKNSSGENSGKSIALEAIGMLPFYIWTDKPNFFLDSSNYWGAYFNENDLKVVRSALSKTEQARLLALGIYLEAERPTESPLGNTQEIRSVDTQMGALIKTAVQKGQDSSEFQNLLNYRGLLDNN